MFVSEDLENEIFERIKVIYNFQLNSHKILIIVFAYQDMVMHIIKKNPNCSVDIVIFLSYYNIDVFDERLVISSLCRCEQSNNFIKSIKDNDLM